MGIAPETRANIRQMFDFKQDCIEPDGMHGGWQTSGTVRVCRLAFNLWNGYTDPEHSNAYSPEDLFCCEFAPLLYGRRENPLPGILPGAAPCQKAGGTGAMIILRMEE